jgi:hypothetical protein
MRTRKIDNGDRISHKLLKPIHRNGNNKHWNYNILKKLHTYVLYEKYSKVTIKIYI